MNWNQNSPYSGQSYPGEESMIDIRVPGNIRVPDMLLEAIMFLLGKAGYRCKLTILPMTHYNHPYVKPYTAPDPYKPDPQIMRPDYTWERWTNGSTGRFTSTTSNITNTAKESK